MCGPEVKWTPGCLLLNLKNDITCLKVCCQLCLIRHIQNLYNRQTDPTKQPMASWLAGLTSQPTDQTNEQTNERTTLLIINNYLHPLPLQLLTIDGASSLHEECACLPCQLAGFLNHDGHI